MEKRWNIQKTDSAISQSLQASLRIHPVICDILVSRGIHDYAQAKSFFRPSLNELHDPWLMKDMQLAVDRITAAMQQGEKILVFGDYDVDGTTSVASMYQFLRAQYANVDFYIPHRYKEGYGVSKLGIDFAKENGFSLIISLDCGIKSVDLIHYAKTLGIDFVVCDHHLPDAILPPAVAILNPKQSACAYPYKELCGCGVGFKLMQALATTWQLPEETYLRYLDLVATAIAADIVPISGENRVLAYYGLKQVNENPSIGIRALMELAAVQKEMLLNNLVFVIAPRVNAAGRMDDAKKAVQLFIEQDYAQALTYAKMLHSDNTDRKEADASITTEALELIAAEPDGDKRYSTLVYKETWHKGVVGIVASRLIETYYRPTIVLTRSGDIVAGSARSVPGFNLYEAIHACREHLLGYGGHFAAAGMTLSPDQVLAFKEKFESVVQATILPEQLIPEIVIDAELRFQDVTPALYNIITQMEPFGPDNMRPVFVARKVADTGFSKIVKEQHIRFVVKQGKISFTGIGFNLAHRFPIIQENETFDIVFTLDLNEWNGEKQLQLKVIDLKQSH
jgi:single-stranded-DNA-specific exonuclease